MKSLVAVTIASALIAGCASKNSDKGSATAAGLETSADKITQSSAKIDQTLSSLDNLLNNPGDVRAHFKEFSASVNDLESSARNVQSKVASMRAKGNDYFKGWETETGQTGSAERKAELQKKFTQIKLSYTEASLAFKPFLSDLKDIETALSNDLTQDGINAIKGPAQKATNDASPVKNVLDKLASQFRELGAAMAVASPPSTSAK